MADEPAPSDHDHRGTSRDYILNRLRREQHDHFIAAIETGEVSAYAVAAALGWVSRPAVLGTGSDNEAKRRTHRLAGLRAKASGELPDLTPDQLQELWLGPSPRRGSLFRTREELRAAWDRGRDYVMATWGRNGRRPQAWWEFEAPALGLRWPGVDREHRVLYEAGVLGAEEIAQLKAVGELAPEEAFAGAAGRSLVRDFSGRLSSAAPRRPAHVSGPRGPRRFHAV
jgi:hypothetical protein